MTIFFHLGLDRGQIVLADLLVTEVDVIIEAVIGCGAVCKVGLGVQALDGLRHDVSGGVADYVDDILVRDLCDGAVVIQCLHVNLPLVDELSTRIKMYRHAPTHNVSIPQNTRHHIFGRRVLGRAYHAAKTGACAPIGCEFGSTGTLSNERRAACGMKGRRCEPACCIPGRQ